MSASNVSLLHETSRQIAAGGSAGFFCVLFQVQRSVADPQSYKSLRDSFRMIFQREGLFGFYKGIIPPILAETPKRAVKFSTFELYKKFLGYMSLPPALTFAIAGLGSGLTEAVVVNPFEVVKVGLQVNRNMFTEVSKCHEESCENLTSSLISTHGKDPTLEFLRKFGIGFVSGIVGSVFNIPFDVAKSRIQGPQPVPGEIKYRSCFKTMEMVYREEGILALYKGGGVMLLVYEHTYAWLQENW
ncbi:Mitochondrial 2-oxodicarboxylate carrier [Apodemus speciosus]|uniref:Mitochondrial 2-oxodicarboxylate carrier n=1 Tax=Apodemus speciosus TaxID=105296 RepID=A0ABQ0FE74_APOSI